MEQGQHHIKSRNSSCQLQYAADGLFSGVLTDVFPQLREKSNGKAFDDRGRDPLAQPRLSLEALGKGQYRLHQLQDQQRNGQYHRHGHQCPVLSALAANRQVQNGPGCRQTHTFHHRIHQK